MYKIYADDVLIYDDTSEDRYLKVASPTLSIEYNTAGSLKMKIPPGNAGYDLIELMSTNIRVEKDGSEFWSGRVLQEDKDFWNNRSLLCEGELAFFNDTVQPTHEYDLTGQFVMRRFLEALVTEHNRNVSDDRKIYVDENSLITVDDPTDGLYIVTNYGKTMEYLNKLVQDYGGYMQVVKRNGKRCLDYLKDGITVNPQTIEFGKNLIDFTSSFDSSEYATVIVPLGEKLDRQEGEEYDRYLTVESASLGDGSIYVKAASEVIAAYGWIEKTVHWDDETDANNLYKRGQKYLSELQFGNLVIELSALDLHYLNPDITDVKLGDYLHVISEPHGLDASFTVKKLEIPLDRPQDTVFKLGGNVKTGFTAVNNKTNSEILEKIENAINEDKILAAAQEHASSLMNTRLNGYITLEMDETDSYASELYISASLPLRNEDGTYAAQRFWKWGLSGLGYTDDGGATWKSAMLMDGTILGERIAAGSIHGSKITAGTLALTTAAGDEALTISLTSRGMAPDSFEKGDIDQNYGSNIPSTTYARSRYKVYLRAGTTVKLTNSAYNFEPAEYSDNTDSESGFVRLYGSPVDRTFTVSSTNYYRFVVHKTSGGTISDNDLQTIASAFDLGGTTATITAEQMNVFGMVTFSDLSGEGRTTVINGGLIDTETITADKINLYSGFTVYKNGDPAYGKTFEIKSNGEVYVNGNVVLSEDSTISFESGSDKTIGDIVDMAEDAEDTALRVAYGVYTPPQNGVVIDGTRYTSTFIDGRKIYSPQIYANTFTAVAEDVSASSGEGGFVMRRGSADGNAAFSIYYFNNQGWEAHLAAENQIIFDSYTRFINVVSFDTSAQFRGNNVFYGNLDLSGGGKIVLDWTTQCYGVENRRPSNPVSGQIYFQTD